MPRCVAGGAELVKGGEKMYHVGGSIVGFGLSKSRINVRLSVQHKCHSVRPGW